MQKRKSMTARFPRCHRHGRCCHGSFFGRNGLTGRAVYVMGCVGFWKVFCARDAMCKWALFVVADAC